jgi:hypothetical protein
LIDKGMSGFAAYSQRIGRITLLGGKLDKPRPLQLEQKSAADHVPGLSVRLHPVPYLAELYRELAPALTGVVCDKGPYQRDILL